MLCFSKLECLSFPDYQMYGLDEKLDRNKHSSLFFKTVGARNVFSDNIAKSLKTLNNVNKNNLG
jgi:hypothetical protein